ncbi:MAG: nucleotidyltransferase family protein [Candidatus Woesearchaeota archaeon]|nr:nucleotidyltransferase family protein [Candidatus Woesearchaeota archaeon]
MGITKITKAVVLAGGLGTRMRYLTKDEIPKALVNLKGRTITGTVVSNLREMGIKEVVLAISHHSSMVQRYFGEGSKFGVKISYLIENVPLGTGGWINLADKKQFKEPFMVLNGDDLLMLGKEGLSEFLDLHKKNNAAVSIALMETGNISEKGVADLKGCMIRRFVEKPKPEEAPSNLVSTGNYIFEPEVLSIMPDKEKISLEKDVFPLLASKGRLCGFNLKAKWYSIGSKDEYNKAVKEL